VLWRSSDFHVEHLEKLPHAATKTSQFPFTNFSSRNIWDPMLSRCAQQLHLLVEELTHAAEVEETPAAENCHILLFDGVNCGKHSIFIVHVPGLNCCTPCENGDYH
jgi:hypothetical protein